MGNPEINANADARVKRTMRAKSLRRLLLSLLVVGLIATIASGLVACSGSSDIDAVKAQNYSVGFGVIVPTTSGPTFGPAVENYAPGGKWSQQTTTLGRTVNYEGGKSPQGKVTIQWYNVSKDTGWSVWAMEVDGNPVSQAQICTFFSAAMSS